MVIKWSPDCKDKYSLVFSNLHHYFHEWRRCAPGNGTRPLKRSTPNVTTRPPEPPAILSFYPTVIISLTVACRLAATLPACTSTGVRRPGWKKGACLCAQPPAQSLESWALSRGCRLTHWRVSTSVPALQALLYKLAGALFLLSLCPGFFLVSFVTGALSSAPEPRSVAGALLIPDRFFSEGRHGSHRVAAWHHRAHPVLVSTQAVSSLQYVTLPSVVTVS